MRNWGPTHQYVHQWYVREREERHGSGREGERRRGGEEEGSKGGGEMTCIVVVIKANILKALEVSGVHHLMGGRKELIMGYWCKGNRGKTEESITV